MSMKLHSQQFSPTGKLSSSTRSPTLASFDDQASFEPRGGRGTAPNILSVHHTLGRGGHSSEAEPVGSRTAAQLQKLQRWVRHAGLVGKAGGLERGAATGLGWVGVVVGWVGLGLGLERGAATGLGWVGVGWGWVGVGFGLGLERGATG